MNTDNSPEMMYVIFSSTPFRTGKLIRKVTGNFYNHVSVSLTPDLSRVYTFARYHINNPLYGGFIEESLMRYTTQDGPTCFRVCALPLNKKQYKLAAARLDYYKNNADKYIYNLFSAAAAPLGRRVKIRNSYTCAEFVSHLLYGIGYDCGCRGVCDIGVMERTLMPYTVFEGSPSEYTEYRDWGNDRFPVRQNIIYGAGCLCSSIGKLCRRKFSDESRDRL